MLSEESRGRGTGKKPTKDLVSGQSPTSSQADILTSPEGALSGGLSSYISMLAAVEEGQEVKGGSGRLPNCTMKWMEEYDDIAIDIMRNRSIEGTEYY